MLGPPPPLSPEVLAALVAVAFLAGAIDAIAGGGGLLTLPALLTAGLDPVLALGTNKGQSVFGSGVALLRFARARLVDGARARVTFPAGLVGALVGAGLVLLLDRALLRPVVLVLLVAAGAFLALRRPTAEAEASAPPPTRPLLKAALIALGLGAYDGFFGPGTGTFLIIAFVAVLQAGLSQATADAKVVNFASNLAAVARFGAAGVVVWKVALPMAVGQAAGGWVGAHLAVKGGAALIRRAVLGVVVALVLKLTLELLRGG